MKPLSSWTLVISRLGCDASLFGGHRKATVGEYFLFMHVFGEGKYLGGCPEQMLYFERMDIRTPGWSASFAVGERTVVVDLSLVKYRVPALLLKFWV